MSSGPYELGMTRPARRAISELLAEDVAAGAVEFITGPLLEAPYRVGETAPGHPVRLPQRPARYSVARAVPDRRI